MTDDRSTGRAKTLHSRLDQSGPPLDWCRHHDVAFHFEYPHEGVKWCLAQRPPRRSDAGAPDRSDVGRGMRHATWDRSVEAKTRNLAAMRPLGQGYSLNIHESDCTKHPQHPVNWPLPNPSTRFGLQKRVDSDPSEDWDRSQSRAKKGWRRVHRRDWRSRSQRARRERGELWVKILGLHSLTRLVPVIAQRRHARDTPGEQRWCEWRWPGLLRHLDHGPDEVIFHRFCGCPRGFPTVQTLHLV